MNNSTTPFPGLVITNVRYLRNSFEDSREFIVPFRVYRDAEGNRPATVEEALEVLFRQLNHVDGSQLFSSPSSGPRSCAR